MTQFMALLEERKERILKEAKNQSIKKAFSEISDAIIQIDNSLRKNFLQYLAASERIK